MATLNHTIVDVLAKLNFDASTGKVYRMYQGPEDKEGPKEYELPLTDSYLRVPFDPNLEWPDFFAEDAEHFYFPVPPLPGEKITVCKTKRMSRQLFPLHTIRVRHGDKIIRLSFSKQLVLDVGNVVDNDDGIIVAYWKEARIAAIGDSVDSAIIRAGINIMNRLVTTVRQKEDSSSSYTVRSDLLITKLLHQKGINVAVHCVDLPSDEDQQQGTLLQQGNHTDIAPFLNRFSADDHTLQQEQDQEEMTYNRDKDPKFN